MKEFILMCIVEDEEGKRLYQSTLEPCFGENMYTKENMITFSYRESVPLIEKPVAYLE